MTKVGMLYICTGKYTVFWPEFYRTFNEKFLPNCEKEYFVFTDAPAIEYEDAPGVHRIYQEPYPWPYSTLKRFSIFLTQETVLSKMDYLFFFNANLTCTQTITEEEFLPRPARGENLLLVQQPGFWDKRPPFFSYDRNPKSTAYIPYNCGKYYVSGGLNGGTAPAFLELCRTLDKRIRRDLQHNVIALWHDESQINRYILFRHDFRVLDPSFCYPEGWDHLPFPCVVRIRSKARYLDIPALRKDAPETQLSPAVQRWNHFAMRAARWSQNHLFKKGK